MVLSRLCVQMGGAYGYEFHIAKTGNNADKPIAVAANEIPIVQKCASSEGKTGHTIVFEPFAKISFTIELSVNFLFLKLGVGGEVGPWPDPAFTPGH